MLQPQSHNSRSVISRLSRMNKILASEIFFIPFENISYIYAAKATTTSLDNATETVLQTVQMQSMTLPSSVRQLSPHLYVVQRSALRFMRLAKSGIIITLKLHKLTVGTWGTCQHCLPMCRPCWYPDQTLPLYERE